MRLDCLICISFPSSDCWCGTKWYCCASVQAVYITLLNGDLNRSLTCSWIINWQCRAVLAYPSRRGLNLLSKKIITSRWKRTCTKRHPIWRSIPLFVLFIAKWMCGTIPQNTQNLWKNLWKNLNFKSLALWHSQSWTLFPGQWALEFYTFALIRQMSIWMLASGNTCQTDFVSSNFNLDYLLDTTMVRPSRK